MLGFAATDWKLSSLTPYFSGINAILRVGAGSLHMEFTNKSTGAVVPFDAAGYTVGNSAPIWTTAVPPLVRRVKSTELMTGPLAHSPFSIIQIRQNFGYLHSYDVSSALGVLAFSYTPLVPPLVVPVLAPFVFAACLIALPTSLASSLATSYIVFSHIR